MDVTAQLSLPIALTAESSIVTKPDEPSTTVRLETLLTVGDSLSVTVTVSVSLPVFPLGSVAVSVIVGSLRSAHVNTLCDSVTTAPQLSSALVYVDPTDTSNCPLEFKNTSSDATASTTGASLSSTVTSIVFCLEFVLWSWAVAVTVTVPTSAHVTFGTSNSTLST